MHIYFLRLSLLVRRVALFSSRRIKNMNCFSCFQLQKSRKSFAKREHGWGCSSSPKEVVDSKCPENKKQKPGAKDSDSKSEVSVQTFTFREIATATRNFRQECLLGEGGFGRVFKGTLAATGQVVAVKQLDRSGLQENKEFLAEVSILSLLHHPNLVNLIGYCADGDQRLLVYDFVKGGSLHDHLLDLTPESKPLSWSTRMRIGFGAAKALEYLHDEVNPPVIDGNMKPSNILLDEDFNPLLSDFGLVKLGPAGDKMHVHSRLMGTYGYSAPEYARGGELTVKSDVYSFGVILLELITGRRAIDTTKPIEEQNLVAWAQPIFRDPKRFPDMADPVLNKKFPEKDLNQAVAIAAMCLQEEPTARPLMSDVVTALSFLSMTADESISSPPPPSTPASKEVPNHDQQKHKVEDSSDSYHNDGKNDHKDSESDHKDSDSDHEDSDSDPEDSESEQEDNRSDGDHKDSRKWSKTSMRSVNESFSSCHKGNKRIRSRIASRRVKDSCELQYESALSSHYSRRGSQYHNSNISRKSSIGSIKDGSDSDGKKGCNIDSHDGIRSLGCRSSARSLNQSTTSDIYDDR